MVQQHDSLSECAQSLEVQLTHKLRAGLRDSSTHSGTGLQKLRLLAILFAAVTASRTMLSLSGADSHVGLHQLACNRARMNKTLLNQQE